MSRCTFVLAVALIVMPAGALADSGAVGEAQPLSEVAREPQDMSATELIGLKTVDVHGEAPGRVEDVLLAKTGRTHYAVLSFDAELGLDNKLYTYPLRGLAPGRGNSDVVIQARSEALVDQAGNQMLGLALRLLDPNAVISDPPFVRASEVLRRTINYDGSHAGVIEDVVVNLASGRLRYVVVDIDGQRFALPPGAFTAQNKVLSRTLRGAPATRCL